MADVKTPGSAYVHSVRDADNVIFHGMVGILLHWTVSIGLGLRYISVKHLVGPSMTEY